MTEDLIEMPVVHCRVEIVLERGKFTIVANKANAIERGHLQDDLDLVIVAMQPSAWMLGR